LPGRNRLLRTAAVQLWLLAEARAIATPVLKKLKDAEAVVIGSGSCGAMVKKFYPELFKDTPHAELAKQVAARTWEFSDFLVSNSA